MDMSNFRRHFFFATSGTARPKATGVLEFGDLHSRTVVSASIFGLALNDSGLAGWDGGGGLCVWRVDLIRQFLGEPTWERRVVRRIC